MAAPRGRDPQPTTRNYYPEQVVFSFVLQATEQSTPLASPAPRDPTPPAPHRLGRQNPLAQLVVIVRRFGLHRRLLAAGGHRVGVRVERGLGHRSADRTGPPSRADAFVRVALDRDVIRKIGNASRVPRG